MSFSFTAVNDTKSDKTFIYDFTAPFSGGPYDTIDAIFADFLFNDKLTGTSTVGPVDPYKNIMEIFVDGVEISGLGRGTGCTAASPTYLCVSGAIGAIQMAYLSPASGTLEVKLNFVLTPYSSFWLGGQTHLPDPAVPEPSSLLLLSLGILGLGAILCRKRRS